MSYLRLRQICLVGSLLSPREREIANVLGLEVCYRDPGVGKYGLENALFTAGGTFLEVVAPTQADTAAGRYVERRHGDGGYMFIVDCDNLEARREHIRGMGVRIVEDLKSEEDFATSEAIHLHPRDTGGCLLSIDRHSGGEKLMGGYKWAGPDWQKKDGVGLVKQISGATMQCVKPAETAAKWADILQRKMAAGPKGAIDIPLDLGFARFVELADARGEGLAQVYLAVKDRKAILDNAERGHARKGDDIELCGVTFVLED